ncbi:MAG: hypothetical protein KAJ46_02530 [Sedimentisphaerales bacterium]|nr:hypothetical protein [Sedimentisphaerales bacterium]
MAWDQFKLPFDVPTAPKANIAAMGALKLEYTSQTVIVTGKDFVITVGKDSGDIESFVFRGRELIASELVPNFWRAPIDNDNGNKMPERLSAWRKAGPDRKVNSVTAERLSKKVVRIDVQATLPAGSSSYRNTYTVYGSGDEGGMKGAEGAISNQLQATRGSKGDYAMIYSANDNDWVLVLKAVK